MVCAHYSCTAVDNAFVYMVFGRLVWNFADDQQLWKIKAWNFTPLFVTLDIVALIVQLYGAATVATTLDSSTDDVLMNLYIYMGGVGIQEFFVLAFCMFAVQLFLDVRKQQVGKRRSDAMMILYGLFIALAMITVCAQIQLNQSLGADIVTRFVSSLESVNIHKASTARYQTMRPSNTASTRYPCSSRC